MPPLHSPLPPGSFLTCSSDDTIRVWTLDKIHEKNARGMYKRNIYSNVSTRIVEINQQHIWNVCMRKFMLIFGKILRYLKISREPLHVIATEEGKGGVPIAKGDDACMFLIKHFFY